ncbi:MAG TPA: PEGA domain-containing protein [Anaeromyxobacter sp.]|nr:PEGA domain-containing protein [Anaeromyxobacter sp.]
MARAGRFTTIAPLPPHGDWRRAVALDRGAGAPRPVVLAFVPSSVLDAPERLAALVRDVEAAARLHHPAAVPVLGTETVGDALAIVEDWRPGATLRALLDVGGRLPPDVAARIAVDVCGALSRAHAMDAGQGRPLAHGAVSAQHVVVGDDGVSRLGGFGETGGDPSGDVRALAGVLYECLAGEPPAPSAAPLDVPGVPPAVAAAVDRALGAAPGGAYASAAAFAESIAAARVASQADVASYAEAILPAEEGGRGALRRAVERAAGEDAEEVSEDYIVEPTDPLAERPAVSRELPRPPETRPGVDPAGVFRAPAAPAPRSPVPLALAVAAVCAVAGFGIGLGLSRTRLVAPPPPVALELPPGAAPAAAAPATVPASADAKPAPAPPRPAPGPARSKAARAAKPQPKAARLAAQKPAAPAGKGTLSVSAPEDAEVFLDGKKIGRGSLRIEIAAGAHRLEVRRGDAKVGEKFSVEPNETWTYDVTPTP